MSAIFENASVTRVQGLMKELGMSGEITALTDSARSAKEAADALGIEVGQVASSIVFKLDDESPLLVITSGRHKVDTDLVAKNLGHSKLHRVDADYVKEKSGFSIGGVSPLGWISKPEITLIDEALKDYEVVWAAAGHPHAVFPTTFEELVTRIGGTPMVVGL
jgi:prolyl-tRNA editing enzyme YbaK/EbsC (Cys-tRNA(Pro) deacylase)|uniref:YbaK/EbsC family protein n=1 Tax=Candidatus Planktophila sp. TaxID=2175601 RepID=UPI00404920A3